MNFKSLYTLTLALLICSAGKSQTWEPLGTTLPQVNNLCEEMCVDTINDLLIVGGRFTQVDGLPVNYLASWDGGSWSAMPHMGTGGWVDHIAYYDSSVWVIGSFSSAGGGALSVPHNWARHSPSGWDLPVNFALGGPGHATVTDSLLFLSGTFNVPGDLLVGLDDEQVIQYSPFNNSSSGSVATIYNYQGTRYIGGGFSMLNGNPNVSNFVTINNLNNPVPVGGFGADGPIREMIEYQGDLIVAGGFNMIAGESITNLARFDGTNWHALGSPDGVVEDLEVFDGKLYAAGLFDTIGGVASRRISVWNGQYWKRVAHASNNIQGVGVYDIEVYNNELYICGDFGTINGQFISEIARMVDSIPIAEAWINDTTVCVGDTVWFQDRSWGPPDSIYWEFGGGSPNTSALVNEYVTYPIAGTYTVTHYAYNQLGIDTSYYSIYVGGPIAEAGPDTVSCQGAGVELLGSGGGSYSWWPLSDLSDSTIANPLATPAIPTTYYLLVTDTLGCSSLDSVFVDTSSFIQAAFTFDFNQINWSTGVVSFTDLSVGATAWEWNFGDGETSTLQNPTHSWLLADTFDITLVVWNADGCTDTIVMLDTIIVFDDSNVDEISNRVTFTTSPNPANDNIAIRWSSPLEPKTVVEVVDVSGRIVYSQQLEGNLEGLTVPCHTWDNGTYFINFINRSGVLSSLPVVVSH